MTLIQPQMTSAEKLASWREEIAGFYAQAEKFHNMPVRQTLIQLAAFTARLSSIRNQVIRSTNKEVMRFRIDEIDAGLAATERLQKHWSRIQTLIETEWKMSGEG